MRMRRLLAVLLLLSMLVSVVPTSVFAVETENGSDGETAATAVDPSAAHSDNLFVDKTVKLEADGTYTIDLSAYATGTPITKTVAEGVTLYGAPDATYQRLCGNPNGYSQAVRGIRLLKEAGIPVKINCSVTPYNVDDLEGIFAFAKEEGLMVQATSYMFPPMRREPGMIGCNDRLSAEEAAYQSARIFCLQHGREEYLRRMKVYNRMTLPAELGEDCPDLPSEGDGIRCRAGKCSFWVTWDGRILPCGMIPDNEAPNVFQEGLIPAWERVKRTVAAIRMAPKCSKCQLRDQCRPCAAMAMTETGTFDRIPEYRCQMTMSFENASKLLERQILEDGEVDSSE